MGSTMPARARGTWWSVHAAHARPDFTRCSSATTTRHRRLTTRTLPYIERRYRGFDPAALVIGDVSEVSDRLATYADLGFTDVLIRNITSDQGQALATIERLAQVRERLA